MASIHDPKTRCQMSACSEPDAKEAGVRWNSVGTEMAYLSGAASLTMLETLAHLNASQLNDDFTLLCTEVPDSQAMAFDMDMLPSG
ncbi:RES domain-containing protein [Salmonella enterica]|nr:RES domain-containing protein [Salmonella enterica]